MLNSLLVFSGKSYHSTDQVKLVFVKCQLLLVNTIPTNINSHKLLHSSQTIQILQVWLFTTRFLLTWSLLQALPNERRGWAPTCNLQSVTLSLDVAKLASMQSHVSMCNILRCAPYNPVGSSHHSRLIYYVTPVEGVNCGGVNCHNIFIIINIIIISLPINLEYAMMAILQINM